MRGKPANFCVKLYFTRITPADAGKTLKFGATKIHIWDHPRGCGENAFFTIATGTNLGSPPRMRGKPKYDNHADKVNGITPADAGKTQRKSTFVCASKDHPRGCGENISRAVGFGGERGSPPRMRGKPNNMIYIFISIRITPADAGKTTLGIIKFVINQDHPRGCGENFPTV